MKNNKRISIIGGPGTGKSTLANNLERETNLPVYHLDGIHYLENWVPIGRDKRDKIILEKVKEARWIMDGTYTSTLNERIEASDLVIFLNYSTTARIKGIISRYLKNKGQEKLDIPGCKEKMNWEFIKCTIKWSKTKKKTINEILVEHEDKNILVFNRRKKLNKWYEKEFNKKIEILGEKNEKINYRSRFNKYKN